MSVNKRLEGMSINERMNRIRQANELAEELYLYYIKPDRVDTFTINYFDITESSFVVTFETKNEEDRDIFFESLDAMEELVEKIKGIFKEIKEANVTNWYDYCMEIEFKIGYKTDEYK